MLEHCLVCFKDLHFNVAFLIDRFLVLSLESKYCNAMGKTNSGLPSAQDIHFFFYFADVQPQYMC